MHRQLDLETVSVTLYKDIAHETHVDEDEDFDFEEVMIAIHDELELLNAEAEELTNVITRNIKELIS